MYNSKSFELLYVNNYKCILVSAFTSFAVMFDKTFRAAERKIRTAS